MRNVLDQRKNGLCENLYDKDGLCENSYVYEKGD